uniref:Uncharacterized protein n=1 Tax=Micrurus surinamensis TaxID=129470 RepID=A0A2D4PHC7_MICSU
MKSFSFFKNISLKRECPKINCYSNKRTNNPILETILLYFLRVSSIKSTSNWLNAIMPIGFYVTQDFIFPIGKTAEKEGTTYHNHCTCPTKTISPAEHVASRQWNIFGVFHWVDDQA